jgi:ATP-dependent RNA helicase SUPV3L1/SUV3
VLKVFVSQLQFDSAHFQVAELEQMLALAEQTDRIAAKLPLKEHFIYARTPVDACTQGHQMAEFLHWVAGRADEPCSWTRWTKTASSTALNSRCAPARSVCGESALPGVLGFVDDVIDLRSRNDGIEWQLKGKRPLAQMREGGSRGSDCHRKKPTDSVYR